MVSSLFWLNFVVVLLSSALELHLAEEERDIKKLENIQQEISIVRKEKHLEDLKEIFLNMKKKRIERAEKEIKAKIDYEIKDSHDYIVQKFMDCGINANHRSDGSNKTYPKTAFFKETLK